MRGAPSSSCSAPRSFSAAARRALPRSSHPLLPRRPPRYWPRRSRRHRSPVPRRPRRRPSSRPSRPRRLSRTNRLRSTRPPRLPTRPPSRSIPRRPRSSRRPTPRRSRRMSRQGRLLPRSPYSAAMMQRTLLPRLPRTILRPPPPPDPGTGLSTIVDRGTNGRLEVALTFDAGADTGYAAEILDLLRDEGIKASFGMTGVWAQANPELVQRMVAEGHQLINHTWDHSSLTGANTQMPPKTPEQVAQQLADTEAVVRDLTGYEMRPYFRPPYGDYDEAIAQLSLRQRVLADHLVDLRHPRLGRLGRSGDHRLLHDQYCRRRDSAPACRRRRRGRLRSAAWTDPVLPR